MDSNSHILPYLPHIFLRFTAIQQPEILLFKNRVSATKSVTSQHEDHPRWIYGIG